MKWTQTSLEKESHISVAPKWIHIVLCVWSAGCPDILHHHQASGRLTASSPGSWHEGPGRSEEDHHRIWAESHWCRHWGRKLATTPPKQSSTTSFIYLFIYLPVLSRAGPPHNSWSAAKLARLSCVSCTLLFSEPSVHHRFIFSDNNF